MSFSEALCEQAESCAALGSPFMARMLPLLATVWRSGSEMDRALGTFEGDIGPRGHSLPLRVASGLHALVLAGKDSALAAAYPPNDVPEDQLRGALTDALTRHEDFLVDWIASPPQTNEVRRSAALIAGTHHLVGLSGVPDLHLSELGASGGLNLMFDRFALDAGGTRLGPENAALSLTPDWHGAAPTSAPFQTTDRRGVDLNPLDPRDPEHALRLRSYLWPDQPHRMALTDAAISVHDATVDRGDAIDWLSSRLDDAPTGRLHLIFHTIAWQYLSTAAQARGTALIEAAGSRATAETPLAWLRVEGDGDLSGAAVTARLWPGDHDISLGRADFHGRWVDWNPVHR